MHTTLKIKTEYAVVGSGPGGAISAFHLAQGGKDVAIFEEGRSFQPALEDSYGLFDMVNKYRNGGLTVTLGKPKVSYVEGKVVGGGSEVNSGLYHRTPPEVLEQWQKDYSVSGISESELNPFFEACEKMVSISYLPYPPPAASQKLKDGADRLGWKAFEVPRWFSFKKGEKRESMSQTYLPAAVALGAKIYPQTRILSFSQENGRWKIKGLREGVAIEISAEHLVLAAGAIHTPALLRRSGITHNIGNSLQIHPTIKLLAEFSEGVNSETMGVPVHQVKEFAPHLSLGCSISSRSYLGLGLLEHPENFKADLSHWKKMAIYYAAISTPTRGTIRVLPGFKDPIVRYPLGQKDIQALEDGLGKLGTLLFEAGAKRMFPSIASGKQIVSRDQLKQKISAKQMQLMTIHLFSSCPMGENKKVCATDSYGRVWGHKNLYISDASLLCSAPGVNPQGTIMAISARNAQAWLGKIT